MMRALYKIGRLSSSNSGDPLQDIVNRVDPETHVIGLELKTNPDGSVSLANEDEPFRLLFEASEGDGVKLGYKQGKSKSGAFLSPTAISTFDYGEKQDSVKKIRTLDKKIFAFYKKYYTEHPEIKKVYDWLKSKERQQYLREKYFNFMVEKYGAMKKKDRPVNPILTVRIDGLLPGERPEYRELILSSTTNLLGGGSSEGQGKCALTLHDRQTIYGEASQSFPFYNLDKPGMITGGFRRETAWKNFPVSAEAGQCLKQARDYLEQNQKFTMPGFKHGSSGYWVIPKFVFGETGNNLSGIMHKLSDYSHSSPGFGLGREAVERFSEVDERIKLIQRLAESHVLLSFLFWEKNNAQLQIRLLVDDVPPTRLKCLIKAQKDVAQLKTYGTWQNVISDDDASDRTIRFSFGLLWPYYKREAQKGGKLQYGEDYLRFIRELYLGYTPDPRLILRLIMEYLEALHKDPDDKSFLYKPLYALCWLRYLCELDLWQPVLKNKGVEMKLDELSIEPAYKERDEKGRFCNLWMAYVDDFYQEHQTMLANPFLFGTFLLGCLVRLMMNIQAHKLSSTPFEKELKGLRLKESDIPVLFSKTMAKLRDYEQGETYKVLDELISDLCLRGDNAKQHVSNEEISAYLAFGLAQGRVFKKLIDLEKKQNGNNDSNSNKEEGV